MVRVVLIALTVSMGWTVTANADLRFPDGRVAQPYQRWADRARMPAPPGTVVMVTANCPFFPAGEVEGCTDERTIWLSYRWRRDRVDFFHELGHVFDWRVMSPAARIAWQRLRGFDGDWAGGPRNGPDEEFADDYVSCVLGFSITSSDVLRKRVCSMIRRQAARV